MSYLLLLFAVLLLSLECFCSPLPNATEIEKTEPDGGFIVVAGGADFYQNDQTSVFLLNLATRKWSIMADLPTATEASQLFYADGKLLIAAGSGAAGSFLMYDSGSLTWKTLPGLNPAVGWGPCGAVLSGSLYLIGGMDYHRGTQVMKTFPTWVRGAELEHGRALCGAATLGNYVYTCGGNWKTCEKYDPTSNSWSYIASINDGRRGQFLVALNGYLYAVGGNNRGTAERYDPAKNTWTYIQPSIDHARLASAAVTDGKLIYLVGGCDGTLSCGSGGTETNIVEFYNPELGKWDVLPPLPDAREAAAVAYMLQMPK